MGVNPFYLFFFSLKEFCLLYPVSYIPYQILTFSQSLQIIACQIKRLIDLVDLWDFSNNYPLVF